MACTQIPSRTQTLAKPTWSRVQWRRLCMQPRSGLATCGAGRSRGLRRGASAGVRSCAALGDTAARGRRAGRPHRRRSTARAPCGAASRAAADQARAGARGAAPRARQDGAADARRPRLVRPSARRLLRRGGGAPPEPLDVRRLHGAAGASSIRAGAGPLTLALREAAKSLPPAAGPRSLLLIHDDADNCQPNLCAAAAELKAAGITAHVVGLGAEARGHGQDGVPAADTGGRFFNAANAEQVGAAIEEALRAGEQAGRGAPPAPPAVPRAAAAPIRRGASAAPPMPRRMRRPASICVPCWRRRPSRSAAAALDRDCRGPARPHRLRRRAPSNPYVPVRARPLRGRGARRRRDRPGRRWT